jgi:hypothetical protein
MAQVNQVDPLAHYYDKMERLDNYVIECSAKSTQKKKSGAVTFDDKFVCHKSGPKYRIRFDGRCSLVERPSLWTMCRGCTDDGKIYQANDDAGIEAADQNLTVNEALLFQPVFAGVCGLPIRGSYLPLSRVDRMPKLERKPKIADGALTIIEYVNPVEAKRNFRFAFETADRQRLRQLRYREDDYVWESNFHYEDRTLEFDFPSRIDSKRTVDGVEDISETVTITRFAKLTDFSDVFTPEAVRLTDGAKVLESVPVKNGQFAARPREYQGGKLIPRKPDPKFQSPPVEPAPTSQRTKSNPLLVASIVLGIVGLLLFIVRWRLRQRP